MTPPIYYYSYDNDAVSTGRWCCGSSYLIERVEGRESAVSDLLFLEVKSSGGAEGVCVTQVPQSFNVG